MPTHREPERAEVVEERRMLRAEGMMGHDPRKRRGNTRRFLAHPHVRRGVDEIERYNRRRREREQGAKTGGQ